MERFNQISVGDSIEDGTFAQIIGSEAISNIDTHEQTLGIVEMIEWTDRWAGLMTQCVSDPVDVLYVPRKRPASEYQVEYEKYRQEIIMTGGFGVTSPYGERIARGIRCVPNKKLYDPVLQEIVQFAVKDHNKSPSDARIVKKDEHLSLVSTVKVNYMILSHNVAHLIILKARDSAGTEDYFKALVLTCFEGCKFSGGLCDADHIKFDYGEGLPEEGLEEIIKDHVRWDGMCRTDQALVAAGKMFSIEDMEEVGRATGAIFGKSEEHPAIQKCEGQNLEKHPAFQKSEGPNLEKHTDIQKSRGLSLDKFPDFQKSEGNNLEKRLIFRKSENLNLDKDAVLKKTEGQNLKKQKFKIPLVKKMSKRRYISHYIARVEELKSKTLNCNTSLDWLKEDIKIARGQSEIDRLRKDRAGNAEVYNREVCTHIKNGTSTQFHPAPYMSLTPQHEVVKPVNYYPVTSECSYLFQVLFDGCVGLEEINRPVKQEAGSSSTPPKDGSTSAAADPVAEDEYTAVLDREAPVTPPILVRIIPRDWN